MYPMPVLLAWILRARRAEAQSLATLGLPALGPLPYARDADGVPIGWDGSYATQSLWSTS